MKSLSQYINESKVAFQDVIDELKINGIKVKASGRFGEIFDCETTSGKKFIIKDQGKNILLYDNEKYSYADMMDEIPELVL